MKENEIATSVAKKLGADIRSIKNILKDAELCRKILALETISTVEYSKDRDIPLSKLKLLIKQGVIESISNSNNRGSKTYIFKNQADDIVLDTDYIASPHLYWHKAKFIAKLYYYACSDLGLSQREEYIMGSLFFDKPNIYEISEERKRQIMQNAFKKVYRFSERMSLVKEIGELTEERNVIKALLESEKAKLKKIHKIEIKKDNALVLSKEIADLDLSVRAYNCLRIANIKTIFELVQYSSSDLAKFRNFGSRSINEVEYVLENLGLKLSDN